MPPALSTAQQPLTKVTHYNFVEGLMTTIYAIATAVKNVDGPMENRDDGHRVPKTSSLHPQELAKLWARSSQN